MSDRREQLSRREEPDLTTMMQMRMERGELGEDEHSEQSLITLTRSRNWIKCAAMAIGIATTSFAIVRTPGPSSISDLLTPPAIRAAIATQSSRSLKLQSPDGVEYEIADDDDCFGNRKKKCRRQGWNKKNEIYRLDPYKKPDRCKKWKPQKGWDDDWYDICSTWNDAYGVDGYYWTMSEEPSARPSSEPSAAPTISQSPFAMPSEQPSTIPSVHPTISVAPSNFPTVSPSNLPTTNLPSIVPSKTPTEMPSKSPTAAPTGTPSVSPSNAPTETPSKSSSNSPTKTPSKSTSSVPTETHSKYLSKVPSKAPSGAPTAKPSNSEEDSGNVVMEYPTSLPIAIPTLAPTAFPSDSPTHSKTPSASPIKDEANSFVETTAVDLSTFTMDLVYATARRLVDEAEDVLPVNHRDLIAINHEILLDAVTSQLFDEFESSTRYEKFYGLALESTSKGRVEDPSTNTVTITEEFKGSVLFEGPPSPSLPSKQEIDATVQDVFKDPESVDEFMERLEKSADPVLAATREISFKNTDEADFSFAGGEVGDGTGDDWNVINTEPAGENDESGDGGGGMGAALLAGVIACVVSFLFIGGLYVKYRRGRNNADFIERKKRLYERKQSPRRLFKNSPTNSDKTDDLSPLSVTSGRKKFFQSLDDNPDQYQRDSDVEYPGPGYNTTDNIINTGDVDNFSMPSYMPDDYSLRSDNYSMAVSQAASFQQATLAANGLPPPISDDQESDDSSVSNMSALDEVRFSSVLQLDGCLPESATGEEASIGGGGDGCVKQMIFNDVWRGKSPPCSPQVVAMKNNNIVHESTSSLSVTKKTTVEESSVAESSSTEQITNVSPADDSPAGDLYDEYPLMPEQSFEKYVRGNDDEFDDEIQSDNEDRSPSSRSFTLEVLKNSSRLPRGDDSVIDGSHDESGIAPVATRKSVPPPPEPAASPRQEIKVKGRQEWLDEKDFVPVEDNNVT